MVHEDLEHIDPEQENDLVGSMEFGVSRIQKNITDAGVDADQRDRTRIELQNAKEGLTKSFVDQKAKVSEVDMLLNTARSTTDPVERAALRNKVEKELAPEL